MSYLLVLLALSATASAEDLRALDRVFDRMYRLDFEGAQHTVSAYIEQFPRDPLGYSVRASAYLFGELDRLKILESEFFNNDKRILDKKKTTPDPKIREALFASLGEARKHADAVLQGNPQDRNALFAMSVASGVQMDYQALVEKRQFSSLSLAKEAHGWALKLLAVDSKFYDAYLTTGLSEYLLGSLPFFVKWFVKFDKAEGSKQQAVKNLEMVAQNGRYFKPFAKVLLAIVHLREKRPHDAETRLAELTREFPENPLFKRELDKLVKKRALVGN